MTVDLTPILQAVIGLCATALTILGGIALTKLSQKTGIQISDAQKAVFDDALSKSITYGVTRADGLIAAKGWDHPMVKNAVVAAAANYAVARFPDAIKAVGLSPDISSAANAEKLTTALERAFPAAALTASASPVTPPTPPTPSTGTVTATAEPGGTVTATSTAPDPVTAAIIKPVV